MPLPIWLGLGVALESTTTGGQHLSEGKLQPALGMDKSIRVKAHFAVYPARHARRPPVQALLSWLRGEAAATEPPVPRADVGMTRARWRSTPG